MVLDRNSAQLTKQGRGVCPNQPAAIQEAAGRQRRRRNHIERLPARRIAVLDRELTTPHRRHRERAGAAGQVDNLVSGADHRGTKKLPTCPLPPITAMRTVLPLAMCEGAAHALLSGGRLHDGRLKCPVLHDTIQRGQSLSRSDQTGWLDIESLTSATCSRAKITHSAH